MTDDLARSLEQISVGAGTFQVKEFIIRSINQQPVWGNVTFAVMLPIPRKGMISVSDRQNFLELQEVNDVLELIDVLSSFFG
jgi:hypothetical protein